MKMFIIFSLILIIILLNHKTIEHFSTYPDAYIEGDVLKIFDENTIKIENLGRNFRKSTQKNIYDVPINENQMSYNMIEKSNVIDKSNEITKPKEEEKKIIKEDKIIEYVQKDIPSNKNNNYNWKMGEFDPKRYKIRIMKRDFNGTNELMGFNYTLLNRYSKIDLFGNIALTDAPIEGKTKPFGYNYVI